MTEDQRAFVEKEIDRHLSSLSEHFDSVQILATKLNSDNSTSSMFRGTGNWYARQGMARAFCNRDQAEDAAVAIAREMKNDE